MRIAFMLLSVCLPATACAVRVEASNTGTQAMQMNWEASAIGVDGKAAKLITSSDDNALPHIKVDEPINQTIGGKLVTTGYRRVDSDKKDFGQLRPAAPEAVLGGYTLLYSLQNLRGDDIGLLQGYGVLPIKAPYKLSVLLNDQVGATTSNRQIAFLAPVGAK